MLWDKFLAAFLVLGAPAAMCFPLSTPAAVDPNVLGVNGTNTTTATTMNQILGDEVVVSGGAPKGGKKPLCTRTPVSSTVDNVYLHMDWVMRLPAAWWKKKFLGQWRTPCILMTEALEYWLDPRMKRCGHVGRFPMEGVCHVSKGPIYDGEEIGVSNSLRFPFRSDGPPPPPFFLQSFLPSPKSSFRSR